MNKKSATLLAIVAALTMSCVACDSKKEESSASPELPVLSTEADTTAESTTEAVTENTADSKAETSATISTEAEETTTTETTTVTEAPTEAQTQAPQTEPQNKQPDEQVQQEPQKVTFSFDTLLKNASGIVSSLGTPLNVSTAPSCYTNGADSKIYEYDGLTIECYVLDGAENICCVTITSNKFSTDKAITIGSSQADVEAAYGAGEASGDYTVYYSGDKELDVKYSNGAVTELLFYTAV